jgi:Clp amino terminal domain, pathogenicity island component
VAPSRCPGRRNSVLVRAEVDWDACGVFERVTPQAARVMTWCEREALASRRGEVETEHMLLALLGLEDGIAAEVFGELGITIDPVRALVVERLGQGSGQPIQGPVGFSALANKVLEVAQGEALSRGSEHIGDEDLLLGIVRTDCGAWQILQQLGADAERVRLAVQKRIPAPVPGRPVNVARLPPRRRQQPAPALGAAIEFRPAADPALERASMVSAGLALTEGRVTFGVSDLLRALARDPELSRVLADLEVDVEPLRKRFGEDRAAANDVAEGGG